MKKVFLILFLLIFMALSACSPSPVGDPISSVDTQIEITPISPAEEPGETGYPVVPEPVAPIYAYPVSIEIDDLPLEKIAEIVVQALAIRDLATVAQFVHPEAGIRFSPYTYVKEDSPVFSPDNLLGLVGSTAVYLWGDFDGSGEPIEMTFDEYFDRFLFSADFSNPEVMAVNEQIGLGNTINNIAEFFPGSTFIEYHFSGFEEEYSGMDWVSLRLVFVQESGQWYLVGLVNDRWTT